MADKPFCCGSMPKIWDCKLYCFLCGRCNFFDSSVIDLKYYRRILRRSTECKDFLLFFYCGTNLFLCNCEGILINYVMVRPAVFPCDRHRVTETKTYVTSDEFLQLNTPGNDLMNVKEHYTKFLLENIRKTGWWKRPITVFCNETFLKVFYDCKESTIVHRPFEECRWMKFMKIYDEKGYDFSECSMCRFENDQKRVDKFLTNFKTAIHHLGIYVYKHPIYIIADLCEFEGKQPVLTDPNWFKYSNGEKMKVTGQLIWKRNDSEIRSVCKEGYKIPMIEYDRTKSYLLGLSDGLPGFELSVEEAHCIPEECMVFYRAEPGTMKAKRELSPAPYPQGFDSHRKINYCWKKGETNEIPIVMSSDFEMETFELFEFLDVSTTRYFKRKGKCELLKELFYRWKDFGRNHSSEANKIAKTGYQLFPSFVYKTNPNVLLLMRERERWHMYKVKENLPKGAVLGVFCDAIYLNSSHGRMNNEWEDANCLTFKGIV